MSGASASRTQINDKKSRRKVDYIVEHKARCYQITKHAKWKQKDKIMRNTTFIHLNTYRTRLVHLEDNTYEK